MELVGEGGGWSLGESGVGTKVRLEVELNSRGEVLCTYQCYAPPPPTRGGWG